MIIFHTNKTLDKLIEENEAFDGGVITPPEYQDLQDKFGNTDFVDNPIGDYLPNFRIPMSNFKDYYMNNRGGSLLGIRAYFALDSNQDINVIFSVSNKNTEPNETAYAWSSDLTTLFNRDVAKASIKSYFQNVLIEQQQQSVGSAIDKISIYHDWSEFDRLFIPKCLDRDGHPNLAGFSLFVEFGYISGDFRGGQGDLQGIHGPTIIYSLWDNAKNDFVNLDAASNRQYDTGNPCPPKCGGIQQIDLS